MFKNSERHAKVRDLEQQLLQIRDDRLDEREDDVVRVLGVDLTNQFRV
jgi:hypothetical protein